MTEKVRWLGFVNNILIIAAGIIVSAFSFVYKRFIRRPLDSAFEKMILPLFDTLDDKHSEILVFFIFLIELLVSLIMPWFFSWIVGMIIVFYLITTVCLALVLVDNNKNWKVTFFIFWIIPYLIMVFFPTLILTIIRKKEKRKPTIIELRRTKLKLLKKKIRYNKLKFWKK